MTWRPSVLVVAPTPGIATTVFAWLTDAGCAPFVVSSFAAAKQHLEERPCFLVSEVRLGEYNGLHLALRAQGPGVPVVLIGEPDPVLQREAAQLGAVYLPRDLDAQQLLAVIQPIVEAAALEDWRSAAALAGPGRADGGTVSASAISVNAIPANAVSFVSVSDRTRSARPANPVRS
jgi:DNA-binding NtrC family response regulator